ncbi:NAD(P)-dependent oxidoreductase, partial [Nonomuraea sp. RK-328]|nr:NAD(P)-dependent oxidoreductase [Nonomuraea sp. RK-328]
VAVDVGGTTLKGGLISRDGALRHSWAGPFHAPTAQPLTSAIASSSWARKDLDYASSLAGAAGSPLLDAVLAVFTRAVAEGRGGEDWSVVNRQPASPEAGLPGRSGRSL